MLNDRTRELLVRAITNQKIYGASRMLIAAYEIEGDRRKQKKYVRLAKEAGYVTDGPEADRFSATTKAYDELASQAPDLVAHWNHANAKQYNANEATPCVLFNRLSYEERKHVAENAKQYKILFVMARHVRVEEIVCENLADFQAKYQEKEAEAKKGHRWDHGWELAITTDELIAHGTCIKGDAKVDWAFKNNLAWGLTKLGLLDGNESKSVADRHDLFGGPEDANLWSDAKVEERIATVQGSIADLQRRLEALQKLQERIGSVGGWDGFRDKYRQLLRETLAAQDSNHGRMCDEAT